MCNNVCSWRGVSDQHCCVRESGFVGGDRGIDRTSGSVAPILNDDRLYITGAGEYLEPGLLILDPWVFIVYNFPL